MRALQHDLKVVVPAGGSIVCMGSGCDVTFEDVVFAACSLVVEEGAKATLIQAQFQDMDESMSYLSICADGPGTSIHMRGVCIAGGGQGTLVQRQASVHATEVTITGVQGTGVEVNGEGSSLVLSSCRLSDFAGYNEELHLQRMQSVHAYNGGHAQLSAVAVSGACYGVKADTGACVRFDGGGISGAAVAGVHCSR